MRSVTKIAPTRLQSPGARPTRKGVDIEDSNTSKLTDTPKREPQIELWCPNEMQGDAMKSPAEHQVFMRRHRLVVEKTYICNGKQWGFDKPLVLSDEPITEFVCETCGTPAEITQEG